MSSTHLTSENMATIATLLADLRQTGPMRSFDRETAAAGFLIKCVKEGMTGEIPLRHALSRHVSLSAIMATAHTR